MYENYTSHDSCVTYPLHKRLQGSFRRCCCNFNRHTLPGDWHKVFSIRSLSWVDLSLGKKDEHYFLLGS